MWFVACDIEYDRTFVASGIESNVARSMWSYYDVVRSMWFFVVVGSRT